MTPCWLPEISRNFPEIVPEASTKRLGIQGSPQTAPGTLRVSQRAAPGASEDLPEPQKTSPETPEGGPNVIETTPKAPKITPKDTQNNIPKMTSRET